MQSKEKKKCHSELVEESFYWNLLKLPSLTEVPPLGFTVFYNFGICQNTEN